MSETATLELLIQIRDELAGLNRTRQGLREGKKEAQGFFSAIKQGLTAGLGMEVARRGIDLLTRSLRASVGAAFQLARDLRQNADALGVSIEAYQVFKEELDDSGVGMSRLIMAIDRQNESLAEARKGVGAAADAYRDLGLVASEVEKLSPDQRVLAVSRAVLNATDQTRALNAASEILSSRGLKLLLGALQNLSRDGYDKVAESMRETHRLMSEDAAKRLRDAEMAIDDFKQAITVATGETLSQTDRIREALQKDFWGVVGAWARDAAGNLIRVRAEWSALAEKMRSLTTPAAAPSPAPVETGPVFDRRENILAVQIADQEARATQVRNAALLTEHERRAMLIPVLERQERLYIQLAAVKFGGTFSEDLERLRTAAEEGKLTEDQLTRLKEMLDLDGKITAARQGWLENTDKPLAALGREIADTSGLVQSTLESGVMQGVSSVSSSVWNMAKGLGNAGDMWRNMGDIAGQVLSELLVKLLILQPLMSALGLGSKIPGGAVVAGAPVTVGGGILSGATPFAMPDVKGAGGGTFVTRGRTHFTVGDNPGGVELVSVLPISGIGQTTVNGAALRMAGGGAALVAGGRSPAADRPITVNQTINVSTGLADSIRAEIVSLMPSFAGMAKAEVQEALLRGELRA